MSKNLHSYAAACSLKVIFAYSLSSIFNLHSRIVDAFLLIIIVNIIVYNYTCFICVRVVKCLLWLGFVFMFNFKASSVLNLSFSCKISVFQVLFLCSKYEHSPLVVQYLPTFVTLKFPNLNNFMDGKLQIMIYCYCSRCCHSSKK